MTSWLRDTGNVSSTCGVSAVRPARCGRPDRRPAPGAASRPSGSASPSRCRPWCGSSAPRAWTDSSPSSRHPRSCSAPRRDLGRRPRPRRRGQPPPGPTGAGLHPRLGDQSRRARPRHVVGAPPPPGGLGGLDRHAGRLARAVRARRRAPAPRRPIAHRFEQYYEGLSNEALWPLYHDAIRTSAFESSWWEAYVRVNERFATAAAEEAAEGAVVWVHDYQLQLVPLFLRELRPGRPHRLLPPHPLPAPGAVHAAAVARGDPRGACSPPTSSASSARWPPRTSPPWPAASSAPKATPPELRFEGRTIRIGAFPISIDVSEFDELARRPETRRRAEEFRQRLGDPRRSSARRRPARLHQGHRPAPGGVPGAARATASSIPGAA